MTLTDAKKTRLLAEGVMGWKYVRGGKNHSATWRTKTNGYRMVGAWRPLEDESHAAEVRERLVALGWLCVQVAGINRMHSAMLSKDREYRDVVGAPSACIAICNAALLALGLAKEKELND